MNPGDLIQLDYVPRPRARDAPLERLCRCGNTFTVSFAHRKNCSAACCARFKAKNRNRVAARTAKCVTCGKEISRRFHRCATCREQERPAVEADLIPLPPSPSKCQRPTRTGVCGYEMLQQVNRDGLLEFWCVTHGPVEIPRILPSDPRHPKHTRRAA